MMNGNHGNKIDPNEKVPCDLPELLAAIRKDDLEAFQNIILELGSFNITIRFTSSKTLWILLSKPPVVSVAAFFGAEKIIQFIAMSDCNFDQLDLKMRHPAHFATAGGKIDILRTCIAKSRHKKFVDSDHNSLYHYAAKFDSFDCFKFLCEYFPKEKFNPINVSGATALHWASSNGSLNIVKYILQKEPSAVNQSTGGGWTPLHYAVSKGHADIVSFLLSKPQIMPNPKRRGGITPFADALSKGDINCIKAFIKSGKKITPNPFSTLLQKGNTAVFKSIVEDPETSKYLNADDISRSFQYITTGKTELNDDEEEEEEEDDYDYYRYRIPRTKYVNVTVEPVFDLDLIDYLCKISSQANIKNLSSVLENAFKFRVCSEILESLFTLKGANPKDPYYLHKAILNCHYEGVEFLIQKGCPYNIAFPKEKNRTVLNTAIKHSSRKIIKFLASLPSIPVNKELDVAEAQNRGWNDIAELISSL